jgi:hypothetical protein
LRLGVGVPSNGIASYAAPPPPMPPPTAHSRRAAVQPATQFCTEAFSQYARLTDADMIFGQQFKHMQGFRYFWQYNVFLFMILGFTALSIVYFSIFPSDRDHLNKVMAQIKAKKGAEMKDFERKLAQQGGALSQVEMPKRKK